MTISVIGLGKLGSCMAAVYASKGHDVIGCDIDESHVQAMGRGIAPVVETNLQEFISKNRDRLAATTNIKDAVTRSSISFIIVPTPSELSGLFSVDAVVNSCRTIGMALTYKDSYHLVVLTSTLLPGDCEQSIIPALEKFSGKTCGKDFGFCYSPLFIAIGSVIHNLLQPDLFLVGAFDIQSGELLESFYHTISDNHAPVRRMSIPSAELTKISVNSYVTMKITFANMLDEIAEHIPGVNIDDVIMALGDDKRIGASYLKPGVGYGGPCFPRDNRAFAAMTANRGGHAPYASKTDEYNRSLVDRWVKNIQIHATQGNETIAIIGVSYKQGTAFCEESQAIEIAQKLYEYGYSIRVFNPDGHDHARQLLGKKVSYHDTLLSCLEETHVVFLGLPLPKEMLEKIKAYKKCAIIDPWRQMR